MDPKDLEFTSRRSFSYRLLRHILVLSSLITLIATALQLYLDYREGVSLIRDQMEQIRISYLDSMAERVWDFDSEGVMTLLKGMRTFRDIRYLEVAELVEEGKNIYAVGQIPGERSLSRRFPLLHGGTHEIGSLTVIASMGGVFRRLSDKTLVILAAQAVKTFIVSAFILFIIRQLVTRHLWTLGEYARELNLAELDRPLVLDRKSAAGKGPDELDHVVASINTMRETLKRASAEMKVKARMEGELLAAAAIQRSFTPERVPDTPGYALSTLFIPAREVSGDYYDFFPVDGGRVGIVVADASGKGISSALQVNTARVLLRDKLPLHGDPPALLRALNRGLQEEFPEGRFLTMGYLLLDMTAGTATCVSAGHEPFVLLGGEMGSREFVKPSGYPFSRLHADLFDERLGSRTVSLRRGDTLVLYSDGLTDVTDAGGEMFGEERFYDLVEGLRYLPAEIITAKVERALARFRGTGELTDDITLVVLKRL